MKKIIYCPDCARELYTKINDKHTMNVTVKCKCGNYYRVNTYYLNASRIDKPIRTSSSGVTFH